MAKSGPKRTCECEDFIRCKTCRKREQQRRYSYNLPKLPLLPRRRFRESRLHLPNDPVELSYLAGLFDGEGCITQYSNNNNWVVQIGMTDKPIMDYLASIGGSMRNEINNSGPYNRKVLMRWRLLAQADVSDFLEVIYPYLRVKRQKAKEALIYLRNLKEKEITREEALERMDELLDYELTVHG